MMNRARLLTTLRIALALLVVAGVTIAVARNWAQVSVDIGKVRAPDLLLAGALISLAPVLTLLAWRRILADLGSPLHLAPAGGIFFVGQLGKYLPGSVWSIFAQAEMGSRLEIPRRRSAVVGLITIGLAVICGFLTGVPALPLLLSRSATASTGWGLLLAVPLLAIVFWPRLLNWGIALGLRVLRREPLEHQLSGRAVFFSSACLVGAWVCSGLHVLVLAHAVSEGRAGSTRLVVATVAGFALASSVSMFAIVLPAGVGLREGLLVLLLAPVLSTPGAAAVVVLARFLSVASDVLFALLGWAWARSHHLLTSRAERERDRVSIEEDPLPPTKAR
jgi:uncharacterized membrane protein YbhN (UPF0104 family)